jgi:hypothetical protein
VREAGCPWVFGLDNPMTFLRSCGFTDVAYVVAGDPTANYGKLRSGDTYLHVLLALVIVAFVTVYRP